MFTHTKGLYCNIHNHRQHTKIPSHGCLCQNYRATGRRKEPQPSSSWRGRSSKCQMVVYRISRTFLRCPFSFPLPSLNIPDKLPYIKSLGKKLWQILAVEGVLSLFIPSYRGRCLIVQAGGWDEGSDSLKSGLSDEQIRGWRFQELICLNLSGSNLQNPIF